VALYCLLDTSRRWHIMKNGLPLCGCSGVFQRSAFSNEARAKDRCTDCEIYAKEKRHGKAPQRKGDEQEDTRHAESNELAKAPQERH
jgi:hypothetical protein